MGTSYLTLDIVICGVNQLNEKIINRLFPLTKERNLRELIDKKDNIKYTAKIFRGPISENLLNNIKVYLNNNFDYYQTQKQTIAKNVVLFFSDENQTLQQNSNKWRRIANYLNMLPELKLPFIIFLSYGEIEQIRNQVYTDANNGDIFGDFRDKRKINILRLVRNLNEENITINYRKILSQLWEINQILNQKPFKPSNNPEANLFRIRQEEPIAPITILLSGFSRKGKSTFINMIFDKIVTLESPSFHPVTTETIEHLLPSQPDQQENIKGGIKLFDVPGLIEGTTNNMSNIIKLIKESIRKQEICHDVINYILFFLSPAPNFQNTSNFLRELNQSRIKVIFIINRDQPLNNGMPNTTKQTLKAHLETEGFNNLIWDNGNNILEVDLIKGVEGRTNEIFRYIYNDLFHNNRFDDNAINRINNLQNRRLFPYLNNNFDLFSKIHSVDDLIERGNRKTDIIIKTSIYLIIAAGFCPIPLVDIPIYLFLISGMLVNIFMAYGFIINLTTLEQFFRAYIGESVNNNQNEQDNINNLEEQIFGGLILLYGNVDINIRFIIRKLIRAFSKKIEISAFLGIFDFIPVVGFAIGGLINLLINAPFIISIGNDTKNYLIERIRFLGGRQNILNIIHGYRDSFSLLDSLSQRNDWTRKIKILD